MRRKTNDKPGIINGVPRGDWLKIIADNFKKLMNERTQRNEQD